MKRYCLICAVSIWILVPVGVWADSLYMPINSVAVAVQRGRTISCANNLNQILGSAHRWSIDNGGHPPPSLQVLTNDLPSPALLFCPANLVASVPTNWDEVDWTKIDYTWISPPDWSSATNVACTCRIHNNYGRADGSFYVGDYRPGWPYVTARPPNVYATPGENVHFDFNYASNAVLPVAFQWRREHLTLVTNVTRIVNPDDPNGVYWQTRIVPNFAVTNLIAQTNFTLLITNIQPADNDFYSVAISNAMGVCVSQQTGLRVDSSLAGIATNEYWSQLFCVNNLKMIGLAAHLASVMASDSPFPTQSFEELTNRDGSPLLGWPTALFCRSDTNRSAPAAWSGVDFTNTSYEILSGDPQNPYAIFCRCRVHGFYVQLDGEALRQPRFNTITSSTNGIFNLDFRVFAGRTNLLETSTDLLSWTPVKSYDSVIGDVQFTESGPPSIRRFYRLRLP